MRHKRHKFNPWVRRFPWRAWQPTPVFLPGESPGQRFLAGYGPQGCKVPRVPRHRGFGVCASTAVKVEHQQLCSRMESSQKKSPRPWLGDSGGVLDELPSQLWVQVVNPLECAYGCKEQEMNGQHKKSTNNKCWSGEQRKLGHCHRSFFDILFLNKYFSFVLKKDFRHLIIVTNHV